MVHTELVLGNVAPSCSWEVEIHLQMPPKLVRNAIKFSRRDSGKTLALSQADRRGLHGRSSATLLPPDGADR